MFARNSRQDSFKYLSPSIADKCWRELVLSSQRLHPFSSLMDEPVSVKFPSARHTMYHSTYSFPKREFEERMRSIDLIAPAGRASFYRESERPELADLAKDAKYQALLADHQRNQILTTGRSSISSSKSRDSIRSRSMHVI